MSAAQDHRADAVTLARGAGVNLLGNIGRLSRALAIVLVTRLFGLEILGLYSLAWLVTDLVARFVAFGQEIAIVYFASRALADGDRNRAARIAGSGLFLVIVTGAIGAAAIWLALDRIAVSILSEPGIVPALRVLAFGAPAFGITIVLLAATRAEKIMKYNMIARSFVEPFAFLVGVIVAWLLGGGLVGLALAQTAALWATAIAAIAFYFRRFPMRPLLRALVAPVEAPALIRYALPTMGKDITNLFVSRMDLILVGRFLSTASVGIYTAVIEVAYLIKDVRQAIEPIFAPVVAELFHKNERERLQATYTRATRWILIISVAYFAVALLAGDTILRIYDEKCAAGSAALTILVFGQLVNGTFGLSEMMLLMIGRPVFVFVNTTILLALLTGLNWLLIPMLAQYGEPFGLTGAAIGTSASVIVYVGIQAALVAAIAHIRMVNAALLKPIVASAVALLAAWLVPLDWLPVAGADAARTALFLGVYVAVLMRLGLDAEERHFGRWLLARIPRFRPRARRREDEVVPPAPPL